MNQSEFESAVERLTQAVTDEHGELRPITRIDFEPLGAQIRWTIWQDATRLHSLTGAASDLPGILTATKMLLEKRAADGVKGGQHAATN